MSSLRRERHSVRRNGRCRSNLPAHRRIAKAQPRATSGPPRAQRKAPMIPTGQDSLNTRSKLTVRDREYSYYSLEKAAKQLGDISRLPFSMKVLLENLLRFEDGKTVTREDIQAIVDWQKTQRSDREIQYRPARVLMQDFTGVPCLVDLAAMRDAI